MKKLLLLFFTTLFSFSTISQNIELDDYTWYVHAYELNGNTTNNSFSPEMTIQLNFDTTTNQITSDLCCGGNFQLDININSSNSVFQGSNFSNTSVSCNETANANFADLTHDFFENNINNNFTFNITEEAGLTVKLDITTTGGEHLILYNTPHQDKNSPIFDANIEWYLIDINSNGNSINLPPSSQEVSQITAYFNHDGSFETNVCDQLTGNFSISLQKMLLNCGNINTPTNNCSASINENFQNTYFNFFSNHANEELDFSISIIDFAQGSCSTEYQMMINSSSGDYLVFSNCPSSLATDKNFLPKFSFYPNPAKEIIFVENNNQHINQIEIIDIFGKKLKTLRNTIKEINISELPNGVYFFKIFSGGNTTIQKIVKE